MWYEFLPSILRGALLTIEVALLSLICAVLLGLLGALAKLSPLRVLRYPATLYTTLVRGVPDLILMLLIFFGGQILLNQATDALDLQQIDLNPFTAGVLTIGFIFGAYYIETFRGAFQAVTKGQLEAAAAYGMNGWQRFSHILFPQMLRFAITPATNNWLVLLKSTALVSTIGLADMTYLANQAGQSTRLPFMFYLVVCLLYLAMTWASLKVLKWLERHYTQGLRIKEF